MRPRAEGCLALSGPLESRASNNRVHRAGGGGGAPAGGSAGPCVFPGGFTGPLGAGEPPGGGREAWELDAGLPGALGQTVPREKG